MTVPKPTERVRNALNADYHGLFDGAGAVTWFRFSHRGGTYRTAKLLAGDREVEVSMSPKGRSVRVWVDGTEVRS